MAYGVVHFFPGGTQDQYEASIAAVHPADGVLPRRVRSSTLPGSRPAAGRSWPLHDSQESWERFRDDVAGADDAGRHPGRVGSPPQETSVDVVNVVQ